MEVPLTLPPHVDNPRESFTFAKPADTPSFSKDDHEGHLLAFVVPKLEPNVSTSFGESDAAHVETLVCFDHPMVLTDQMIFGAALVPRLTGNPDVEIVLGRLSKGTAKPGRSAPWLLDEATADDEARAQAFFATHATRLKSGAIVVELPDKSF
jgi:hypothetical protein